MIMKNMNKTNNSQRAELKLNELEKVAGGLFATEEDFDKAVAFMNRIDGSEATDRAGDLFFEFACDQGSHTYRDFQNELRNRGIYRGFAY